MNLLQMSLSGAIFILAVLVIRAVAIDKLPKQTFLILWYIALFRLLLPVTFPFPLSVDSMLRRSIPVLDTFENDIANFTTNVMPGQPMNMENGTMQSMQFIQTAQTTQAVQDHSISVIIFLIIWAAGAAITAIFFIVQYLRCRHEFQTALPVQNDFARLWHRRHPLWRPMEIRQLTGLSTPLTYGVFHPVILMPKNADWQNERQMQYILYHEYVHIRRFDALGKLIASAALCLHWFNPLVWALYILFHRDIELSCDECVIRHFGGQRRKEYAMALVRMEEQRSNPAPFSNYFNKNTTEERIKAIMKFKKKTIFALAFAAIIIVAGTVVVFAMAPGTDHMGYGDILQGNAPFLYASEGTVTSKNIGDVPALFDPNDAYMKIWNFAVQDLDGDGTAEVILSVFGVTGDTGGYLILHQMDGNVYGYTADFRTLTDLKTDGTYNYSDPTGAVEGGICSITAFSEAGYTCDKFTYGHGANGEWNTFVVNHQSASEEEYAAAATRQAEKQDAAWYDFTAENILSEF